MANGRKYTAYFNADSSGFKKGTDQMVQALEKVNKELVNNQYRQKECSKVISDAQKEIKKLEKEEKEKGKLDEDQKKKLKDLNDTIESEKVKLAQLRTEQAGIKNTISELSKEISGNNQQWTTLKATIANLTADGLELLARKLLEVGKNVIAVGEQFSSSMSEVGAISGATAEQMELLEKTAREYGAATRFSASESAQALKYMALAGWDTQQSIDALGSVLDLAAAGNMDLARASDIVTDYITAFGLAAEDSAHFVDVMAYAMAHSNTNVEQLGEAYKNCAASAASMGYSVEEVTAVLMTMANAGVKGGEAGTTLNTIMTRLATDTKGCATALKEIDDSLDIFDDNGNLKSLSEILDIVTKAFDGMNDAQKAALSKVIAGQNQYTGFQTILKGLSASAKETGQSFGDYAAALEECDGVSEGMAKTMSDNLSGDLKTMQSAFEELALKIYDSGETPLRDLVQLITEKGVPALESLISHMDVIVPIFVAAASAVGAYKAALGVQSIIKGITQATAALTAAKAAEKVATDEAAVSQAALNTVQAANPIGLVVGAIAMLVAGLTTYSMIADGASKSTGEYADELNRAKDAIDDCNKQLDNAKNHYSDTIANSQAQAAQIKALSEEYEKLRLQENKTEGQSLLLDNIAEQLAKSMGKTSEELKDQAGNYRELTKEVDEYIKKLKQQAEIQAATELYGEAVKAKTKASVEKADLEEKAKAYYNSHKAELDEYELLGRKEGSGRITDVTKKYEEFRTEIAGLGKVYQEASEAVELYSKEIDKTVESQVKAEQATTSAGTAAKDAAGQFEEAADKVDEYAQHLLNGDSGYDLSGFYELFTSVGDAAEELKSRMTDANKALEDNRTEIKNTRDEAETLRKALKNMQPDDDGYDEKARQLDEANAKIAELKGKQEDLKKAVRDATKAYQDAAWKAKTLSERLSEIGKTSASVRSEMNSLTNTFKDLEEGNLLSIDTLLQLTEKYPEYAAQILNSTDNLNAQKDVVKLLYEVKKQELILSMQAARDEIQAENDKIEAKKRELEIELKAKQAHYDHAEKTKALADNIKRLKEQIKELNDEYDKGKISVDAYNKAMSRILYLGIGSGNNNQNNNYSPQASPQSSEEWTWGWMGEQGTGSTSAQARSQLVERVHALGKINDRELKEEYEKILREEQLTADESYNIRLKLKSMTDKLRQSEEDENKKRIQSRLDYAKAAYEKFVKGEIDVYKKASDDIKNELDKKLKDIDAEEKKRQQKEEDEKRRKEIQDIEDELYFNGRRMTELEKQSLLRRKQDIINEQSRVDRERSIEKQKIELQESANARISKNTEMIEKLNATLEKAANYFAKLSGTQTAAQVVNNSSSSDNRSFIYNGLGMSYNAFLERLLKDIY